jgi:hypothetical protein
MNAKLANKKVAVILGFYNGNDFINAQINSILNQKFKNYQKERKSRIR